MVKMVVLGASGRLGRAVQVGLASSPDIQVIAQSRTAGPGVVQWAPENGPDALHGILAGADCVLNLIGATPAENLDQSGFDRINVDLAVSVLHAARRAGVGRVLMASSAAVYGRPTQSRPFREDDALAPLSAYGLSKQRMEEALLAEAGQDLCILRIGNIVGSDALLGQVAGRSMPVPITLDRFADGAGPRRSYLGPTSFARIIGTLAAAERLPDLMNVTSVAPLAMASLVDALNQLRPGTIDLKWRPAPETAIAEVALDATCMIEVTGVPLASNTAEGAVEEWLDQGGLA